MKFADIVCFDAVIPDLDTADRDEAIRKLVESLYKEKKLGRVSRNNIFKALIKRENEASTGLGKGVAVPHVKHSAIKEIVMTVGQSSAGIDFSALDKQLVYSMILLISPENDPDIHLQAMQKIFRHLQQEKFRKFLIQAKSVGDIKVLFLEADDNKYI
ncbi:MAG: PTS sugar transporter subunit IIA [Planctomycetota bacterium]|jgi:mannitol/fructose-specific phosphotransferase system IIA component (Ntr-type)